MGSNFKAQVIAMAQKLDRIDYYRLLSVSPTASHGEIRAAYHAQSRLFHPDRFFNLPDSPFKQGIYAISKRVTEAYVTLRDPERRRFYDHQLRDSEGLNVRYTEQSEVQKKQNKQEETGKTEQGRRLYRQGMKELQAKNYVAAERTFKTALAYEPDNELFQKLSEEASSSIKTDFRIK